MKRNRLQEIGTVTQLLHMHWGVYLTTRPAVVHREDYKVQLQTSRRRQRFYVRVCSHARICTWILLMQLGQHHRVSAQSHIMEVDHDRSETSMFNHCTVTNDTHAPYNCGLTDTKLIQSRRGESQHANPIWDQIISPERLQVRFTVLSATAMTYHQLTDILNMTAAQFPKNNFILLPDI